MWVWIPCRAMVSSGDPGISCCSNWSRRRNRWWFFCTGDLARVVGDGWGTLKGNLTIGYNWTSRDIPHLQLIKNNFKIIKNIESRNFDCHDLSNFEYRRVSCLFPPLLYEWHMLTITKHVISMVLWSFPSAWIEERRWLQVWKTLIRSHLPSPRSAVKHQPVSVIVDVVRGQLRHATTLWWRAGSLEPLPVA